MFHTTYPLNGRCSMIDMLSVSAVLLFCFTWKPKGREHLIHYDRQDTPAQELLARSWEGKASVFLRGYLRLRRYSERVEVRWGIASPMIGQPFWQALSTQYTVTHKTSLLVIIPNSATALAFSMRQYPQLHIVRITTLLSIYSCVVCDFSPATIAPSSPIASHA
jgi:hypothetical protein